jgi:hypothetical protein
VLEWRNTSGWQARDATSHTIAEKEQQMSKPNSILTAKRCREVFYYDGDRGVLILRICTSRRTPAGTLIGSDNGKGYLVANVDKVSYRVHRLVWLWVHGKWPDGEIDHINGVRHDNRIENLRVVDRSMNNQNLKRAQRNNRSSGLLGAYRHGRKWQAQIMIDKTPRCLGTFDTPDEAHAAYLAAKRLHHPGCTI